MGVTHVTTRISNLAQDAEPWEAEPLLGVVALENTGVVVDPVTRTLHRMHVRPLK